MKKKAVPERAEQPIKEVGDIKVVDVSVVDEWDRNPRSITEQDFERLKKQIVDLGVYKPLVVCEEAGRYIVLGGNMRLKAIKALGIKRVAISVVSARSEAERVKYALSDNDRAGYYEQEDLAEMIKGVSSEIDLSAFKVDLGLAVPASDFFLPPSDGIIDDADGGDAEDVDASFSREQLTKLLIDDLVALDPDLCFKMSMTKSYAAYEFNRLSNGKGGGSWISFLFNPHRITVKCSGRKTPYEQWKAKHLGFMKMLARMSVEHQRKILLPGKFYTLMTIGVGGTQMAADFPPEIARELYLRYTEGKDSIRILDPCHGWGGRLIGALSLPKRVHYCGFDPAKKTSEGVRNLAEFLLSSNAVSRMQSSVDLRCSAFEDAIVDGGYDFAFTSPPYYDTERYSDDQDQAHIRYKTYNEFKQKFLRKMIEKTISSLVPNGSFVINVGDLRYKMADDVMDICKAINLTAERIIPVRPLGGIGMGQRTNEGDGEGEPFIAIRRR